MYQTDDGMPVRGGVTTFMGHQSGILHSLIFLIMWSELDGNKKIATDDSCSVISWCKLTVLHHGFWKLSLNYSIDKLIHCFFIQIFLPWGCMNIYVF